MGKKHRRHRTIMKSLKRKRPSAYEGHPGGIYLIEDAWFIYWLDQAIEKEKHETRRDRAAKAG